VKPAIPRHVLVKMKLSGEFRKKGRLLGGGGKCQTLCNILESRTHTKKLYIALPSMFRTHPKEGTPPLGDKFDNTNMKKDNSPGMTKLIRMRHTPIGNH
jgi:hypothetical protein